MIGCSAALAGAPVVRLGLFFLDEAGMELGIVWKRVARLSSCSSVGRLADYGTGI